VLAIPEVEALTAVAMADEFPVVLQIVVVVFIE
jgi:hypothetical protein